MTRSIAQRIPPLPAAEWSEADRQRFRGNLPAADRYLSGDPDGPAMPPILGLLARHGEVGAPWLGFTGLLMQSTILGPRERELLILRVAARTHCEYMWSEHLEIAERAGLTVEEIDEVRSESGLRSGSSRDNLLLSAADELVANHTLSDGLWQSLSEVFEERQLIEIIFVVGSWVCLAMFLNSAGLEAQTD
jgi:AhpD family alkylhydroperoxidase